jgi:enamine deaminase RidA (YjgF/YER057c/UK114 family)
MSQAEARLRDLGLELPPTRQPIGEYVGAVQVGNLLYVSGHGPIQDQQRIFIGKLGQEFDVEQGRAAAQLVMLNALRTVKDALGDLDRVRRVVKLLGFVNSAAGFHDQPKVIDGASELLVNLFGERGRHARSAVGMFELPFNIAVEIEMIIEIDLEQPSP